MWCPHNQLTQSQCQDLQSLLQFTNDRVSSDSRTIPPDNTSRYRISRTDTTVNPDSDLRDHIIALSRHGLSNVNH